MKANPSILTPSRAFTLVELLAALAIVSVVAAAAIPALTRHIRSSQTAEVTERLGALYRSSAAYALTARPDQSPVFAFPDSVGPSPAERCCAHPDGRCPNHAAAWASPSWKALNFELQEPQSYQYSYLSQGQGPGAHFTARATGDLDCDHQQSQFERTGVLSPNLELKPGRGLTVNRPLE